MKFKIGDTVDYESRDFEFRSCTVVGFAKKDNDYIIQLPKKYKVGWISKEWHKEYYGVKAGIEGCWCADESRITLSKPNKRGKNPRGKNGKFIKTNTLEDRVTALEEIIKRMKEA